MKTRITILLPIAALVLAALAGCDQKSENGPAAATNSPDGQNTPSTLTATNVPTSSPATTNAPANP